jgi:hypothetical protein
VSQEDTGSDGAATDGTAAFELTSNNVPQVV